MYICFNYIKMFLFYTSCKKFAVKKPPNIKNIFMYNYAHQHLTRPPNLRNFPWYFYLQYLAVLIALCPFLLVEVHLRY